MWSGLLRSGAVLGGAVLAGRVAGFARDLALAHRLGSGLPTDLAVYALTLPDVFTNLLVAGAFSAALVPEFKADPLRARSLFLKASGASLLAFGALAAVAAAGGGLLVRLLAPGLPGEAESAAASLAAGTLLAIPLSAGAAVTAAYLQSKERFAWAALGTLFFNAVLIVAILGWVRRDDLSAIAWGVAAAAAVRWLPQLAQALVLSSEGPGGAPGRLSPALLRRYAEALASLGVLTLVSVAMRAFASMDGPGALSSVHYAQKIAELPMGVAVGVLGVVLLPRFSELHAAGETDRLLTLARQSIWLVWALAVPAALALAWFSGPLVHALFRHGALTSEQADLIAALSSTYLLGLPAQGLCVLLYALLAARKDTGSPLRAGLLLFGLYLGASWLGQRWLGLQGVVAAGMLYPWALAATYLLLLRRNHGLAILRGDLALDLLLALAAAAAGIAPVAVLAGRKLPPLAGLTAALLAGGLALGAVLLPRYRTLPRGLRTFSRIPPQ